MLNRMMAHGKAWIAQWQSRRKASHRHRQKAAVHRYDTLAEIQGKDAFARRIGYLRKLDPLVFEELVLDGFKRKGCLVERGTRYSGDGGLDGKVFRDNHWIGIQCKRYKDAIQTAHVKQFGRDLSRFGLTEGYFVHTGRTPAGLRHRYGQIIILSGQELIDFLV
ncbi:MULTISPECIES: restriction endonuclease [Acidithiobacillus]|nr:MULTISPECIES: restriction endonuclease [Acidithiobacillus]MBE7567624.1 restriction endonuclease [Acidithiobacillus sp. HP-11]MBU2750173.1 restriction endonuclease [Acidithiobacillus thiooxidans]MBU2843306.1 restriction endonuclease [Acidithiobacillus thiooxidans]